MNQERKFRENIEHALNEFFPKNKCNERGAGLLLFSTAVLEHERIMCQVRSHMGHLLGDAKCRECPEYEDALMFYKEITK